MKRDRLEVIHDILKTIMDRNNTIKPTPLLRLSNLSSQRFIEYMNELLDKDFVKEMPDKKGRRYYTLTDKGFKYIEKYSMIRGFITEFEL